MAKTILENVVKVGELTLLHQNLCRTTAAETRRCRRSRRGTPGSAAVPAGEGPSPGHRDHSPGKGRSFPRAALSSLGVHVQEEVRPLPHTTGKT